MKSRLGRRLRNGILFGAPLALSVHCDSPQEEPARENKLVINLAPAAPFIEALDACLADSDACVELCDQVLVEHGYTSAPGGAQIFECEVTKQPTSIKVEMTYEIYPVAVGCGVVSVNPASQQTSIGSHYAALAELEASSVHAFAWLARDLRRHAAPRALVLAALEAAEDEARHAEKALLLARAWGGTPRPLPSPDRHDRSLVELCTENTVDGCIHETFGAAIAAHQAETAKDPFIQSMMASIAADERRHAGLAGAIDRWLRPQLSLAQQRAVEQLARGSARRLAASQKDAPAAVSELAGFPSARQARALIARAEQTRRARRGAGTAES